MGAGGRRFKSCLPDHTPEHAPICNDIPLDDVLAELHELATEQVAAGFSAPGAMVESIQEYVLEEHRPPDLPQLAQDAVDTALRKHFEAQAAWPVRTDCDRLDDAFAALRRSGIAAEQHWT